MELSATEKRHKQLESIGMHLDDSKLTWVGYEEINREFAISIVKINSLDEKSWDEFFKIMHDDYYRIKHSSELPNFVSKRIFELTEFDMCYDGNSFSFKGIKPINKDFEISRKSVYTDSDSEWHQRMQNHKKILNERQMYEQYGQLYGNCHHCQHSKSRSKCYGTKPELDCRNIGYSNWEFRFDNKLISTKHQSKEHYLDSLDKIIPNFKEKYNCDALFKTSIDLIFEEKNEDSIFIIINNLIGIIRNIDKMRFDNESVNKLASYYEQDNVSFSKITASLITASGQEIIKQMLEKIGTCGFDVTDSKHPWNWKKSSEEQ